jgi:hypothetical protein
MTKQSDISKKIEKSREKIENLRFAYEHSLDALEFLQMIEEEQEKINDLRDKQNEQGNQDTLRDG